MKLRLSFFSICAMLLLAGALFTSCTQTTTPGTPTAYTDTYSDMPGLKMNTQYQFSLSGNASSTLIAGVSAWTSASDNTGTVRVFWTRGAGDSNKITVNAVQGSTPAINTIVWAPANLTSMVRIYETSDPSASHPSGLILGTTSVGASISGSSKPNIDLVLVTIPGATLPSPVISLQAADITGGVGVGGKMTDIADAHHLAGGLAMDIDPPDPKTLFPSGQPRFLDLPFRNFKDSSVIIFVKTADATPHYARVEIVPQPTGSSTAGYLWGDTDPANPLTSKRFIDVNTTYQATAGWGYVGRPGLTRRAIVETPKSGSGLMIR